MRLRRLVIQALVVGALVNVMISWWAAVRMPVTAKLVGSAQTGSIEMRGVGVEGWVGIDASDEVAMWGRTIAVTRLRTGLPFRGLESVTRRATGDELMLPDSRWRMGVGLDGQNEALRRLPLWPRPVAFAANSIVYGIPAGVLLWLAPWVRLRRAWHRDRRRALRCWGLCFAAMLPLVVLVSWVCASVVPFPTTTVSPAEHAYSRVVSGRSFPGPAPAGAEPVLDAWISRWWSGRVITQPMRHMTSLRPVHAVETGFPFPAMTSIHWSEHWDSQPSMYQHGLGLPPPNPFTEAKRLPLRPLPLWFAINALVYALSVIFVHAMWCEARERWRAGRGRCAGCGYELAGLEVCPECGCRLKLVAWGL